MFEKFKNRKKIIEKHLNNGVFFLDENTVYIDENVKIGKGTKIYTNVIIEGSCNIGENVTIGMNSHIKDTDIGDGSSIDMSVIKESRIGKNTSVGPFAYIRPNSNIGDSCKIGDFVEVKNSNVGDGSKASHLTYIGDADVGKNVNLGCGVVFVNYDGANKARSTVNDGAFIGCNSNVIAPVNVGNSAYIAAGTTVTDDVSDNSLCIGRVVATEKKDWVPPKKNK